MVRFHEWILNSRAPVTRAVLWQCIDGKLGLHLSTEPRRNRVARTGGSAAPAVNVNQPHAFDARDQRRCFEVGRTP